MLTDLVDALHHVTNHATARCEWLVPYAVPKDPSLHQFVLFLKPEATDLAGGVHVDRVLQLILEKLEAFEVAVGAAGVLPGSYLEEHCIIDQHYGVINSISKQGLGAISEDTRTQVDAVFGDDIRQGARVLGAHAFLEQNPAFSPLSLQILNENLGTTKLGGGCYAMKMKLRGQTLILLNPFHPQQLLPFTSAGNAIIVLEGLTRTPWNVLRSRLTGATDPQEAESGSIRQSMRVRQEALGLNIVNQSHNAVHLSAGPLEGMVEVQRFFSDHEREQPISFSETCFGKLLQDRGLDEGAIARLATNPTLDGTSAFDLTEEKNAKEAAALLSA